MMTNQLTDEEEQRRLERVLFFNKPLVDKQAEVGDIWGHMIDSSEINYFLIMEEVDKRKSYYLAKNLKNGKMGIHQVGRSYWRFES
jgi:hypothetical protein